MLLTKNATIQTCFHQSPEHVKHLRKFPVQTDMNLSHHVSTCQKRQVIANNNLKKIENLCLVVHNKNTVDQV